MHNRNCPMPAPHIVTPPPGPLAKAEIAQHHKVHSPSLIKEYPLVVRRAAGMEVEDVDGNRFLDFMSGIAVTLTGHCHPQVVQAIQEQAAELLHICGTDFYYAAYTALCRRLSAIAPGAESWRVYLGNSGAEAVEAALKLARFHTKRPYIIAFYGAFHGRTYGAMSVTASKVVQRTGFGPHLPGVIHMPYGDCSDCTYNLDPSTCGVHCVESWRGDLFTRLVDPAEVAAVIVEPIQGEGGHRVPGPLFFAQLRKLCDEYGILLIADEIQTGMGRTGTFFAIEQWGVTPNIITLAQGLGSGLPISATLAKARVMSWPRGSHGSTFGGNPIACAAANATLDLILGGLLDKARAMGTYLGDELQALLVQHAQITEVRGRGLMRALAFETQAAAAAFELACFARELLVLGCGQRAVRLAPALILEKDQADTALAIMEAGCWTNRAASAQRTCAAARPHYSLRRPTPPRRDGSAARPARYCTTTKRCLPSRQTRRIPADQDETA